MCNKKRVLYVYVLHSLEDLGLYIGFSTDLKRRMAEHKHCMSSATKHCGPGKPNHYEAYVDQRDAKGRGWPQNALRHSFGSYHLAQFNDAAKLALEMGNSPATIFRHYRQLVKPKDAERYWKIAPAPVGKKLVAFAAQSA